MKIAIITNNKKSISVQRLKESSSKKGHIIKILNPLDFNIFVDEDKPNLYYKNKLLSKYDAVIPRISAKITFYGTAVVRQFEQMGVFTLNSSRAIASSRDKLRAMQILSKNHIPIPPTAFVRDPSALIPTIEKIGGAPVIIKVLEGTQGIGVILAESNKAARSIIETLQDVNQNVLIQKFVKESEGKDIRAFVVGNKVVAAMRREASAGEFRSNVHRGGKAEPIKLSREYEEIAIRASQIFGLRIAGVDLIESNTGPLVLEVNSSPGLEGIEKATGIDVASHILEHLEEMHPFSDVDIHQRLSLNNGYIIADFYIDKSNGLHKKQIMDSTLHELKIRVLSIHREQTIMPNPPQETELLIGDLVTCYGPSENIKLFKPKIKRRNSQKREKKNALST